MTTPGTWMLVDAESRRDLWTACWATLRANADVADVLATVTGAGSANPPDFALVRCDGNETRVVVRGEASAELRYAADSTMLVQAAGDDDWADRTFAGMPFALRLTNVSEPGHVPDDVAVMPLDHGVAHASTVGFGISAFVPPPTRAAEPANSAGSESALDLNLDDFLVQQSAESASVEVGRLPLDDTSWLMDQTASQTAHQAIKHAVDSVPSFDASTRTAPINGLARRVAHEPSPSPSPSPSVAPVPVPEPETAAPASATGGLSFDAEATTFRPGRAPVQVGSAGQSVVLAVTCPSGHVNQPRTPECGVCRLPIAPEQQPRALARPPLGRLRLSNGEVHLLDRGFLLGRSPVPRTGATGPEPNVLRLISRDGDVSRTHAEIRLEGWQVIVADLGSMNGTYVTGPGLAPRVLSGGDEQVIEPGCVVTLAHDVWIAYEAAE